MLPTGMVLPSTVLEVSTTCYLKIFVHRRPHAAITSLKTGFWGSGILCLLTPSFVHLCFTFVILAETNNKIKHNKVFLIAGSVSLHIATSDISPTILRMLMRPHYSRVT